MLEAIFKFGYLRSRLTNYRKWKYTRLFCYLSWLLPLH